MMVNIPIGLIIKDIITEKKIPLSKITDTMGFSRQSIYNSYNKPSMTEEEIVKWASALNVKPDDIYKRWNDQKSSSSPDNSAFGSEVVEKIEDHFRKLEEFYHEQLRAKDQQIEKLLGLLGKPKGCPSVATLYQLRVQKKKKSLQKGSIFLNQGYKFGYTPACL